MDDDNASDLQDGATATYMGDGVYVIRQKDEGGRVHSVAINFEDIARIHRHALTISAS